MSGDRRLFHPASLIVYTLTLVLGTGLLRAQEDGLIQPKTNCDDNRVSSVLRPIAECLAEGRTDCAAVKFEFLGVLLVNTPRAFVVIKDIKGATQLLLIPTRQITGIEGTCLESSATNYFREAWKASDLLAPKIGAVAPKAIGLAVNPAKARTDSQLHIHIDWIPDDVLTQLNQHKLSGDWKPVSVHLKYPEPHVAEYQARRMPNTQFDFNPFQEAKENPSLGVPIEDRTVAVIATNDRADQFIVLVGKYPSKAEELQMSDHDCRYQLGGDCPGKRP